MNKYQVTATFVAIIENSDGEKAIQDLKDYINDEGLNSSDFIEFRTEIAPINTKIGGQPATIGFINQENEDTIKHLVKSFEDTVMYLNTIDFDSLKDEYKPVVDDLLKAIERSI